MSTFALPDLGEGLQEAEIITWHVAEGDHVVSDQPLVSVETEKALVEVPSPQSGRIARLLAKPGDHVRVGTAIVVFGEGEHSDKGTVVGELGKTVPARSQAPSSSRQLEIRPLVSPAIRALARERGVDTARVAGTGPAGALTRADIERAAGVRPMPESSEALRGMRRAMAVNMARAYAEVVPAMVWDEADIESWWSPHADISLRLIRSITIACAAEPALNARYDGRSMTRQVQSQVDLGIAVDTVDGLIVPVMRDVAKHNAAAIRLQLDSLKAAARSRTVTPSDLRGPTITLSNFGMLAGRQAVLVVIPPQVAIVGAGRIVLNAIPADGAVVFHHVLALSVTFDHRVVTGGEAARFLKAMIGDLQRRD